MRATLALNGFVCLTFLWIPDVGEAFNEEDVGQGIQEWT